MAVKPSEMSHCGVHFTVFTQNNSFFLLAITRMVSIYDGCKAIGLKAFSDQVPIFGNQTISNLLNDAWREFLAKPQEYGTWEESQLADLRVNLEHLNTAEQSTHDVWDTSTSNTGDSA